MLLGRLAHGNEREPVAEALSPARQRAGRNRQRGCAAIGYAPPTGMSHATTLDTRRYASHVTGSAVFCLSAARLPAALDDNLGQRIVTPVVAQQVMQLGRKIAGKDAVDRR
jgi:hypothetical protein